MHWKHRSKEEALARIEAEMRRAGIRDEREIPALLQIIARRLPDETQLRGIVVAFPN